jgi:hypothetical protein
MSAAAAAGGAGAQPAPLPRFDAAAAARAEASYTAILQTRGSPYGAAARRNLAALYRAWARADPAARAARLHAAVALYQELRAAAPAGDDPAQTDDFELAACLLEAGRAGEVAALGLDMSPPATPAPGASAEAAAAHLQRLLTLTNVLLAGLDDAARAEASAAQAGALLVKWAEAEGAWAGARDARGDAYRALAHVCSVPGHGAACASAPQCAVTQLAGVQGYLDMVQATQSHRKALALEK